MAIQRARRRFTVDEYHRMAEVGLLTEDDRVELIDGEIVEMAPIGIPHASTVRRLNNLLAQRFAERAIIDVQNPVTFGRYSEPQPDLTLLRPRPGMYSDVHPGPDDVLLVIEVADSSVEYDRQTKMPLYAEAGFKEAWLIDLTRDQIEAYRDPAAGGYREIRILRRGDRLSPEAFVDAELGVDEILP
ncbi:MAG: Uma2 family endonuclease [Chloroflexi bacterium]|nr:Uma2 family endonuclease [Chloroflexota bacterium]